MHQILIYADSLSWGIIPDTRSRFRFDQRWPGIVEIELQKKGLSVRVIEDCLNGRRTVWKDPFKPGRNGLLGLEQRIEINSPLSLVVVFLGTNDFQETALGCSSTGMISDQPSARRPSQTRCWYRSAP